MAKRVEIDLEKAESITGGYITWSPNGTCYAEDNPGAVYHFDINKFDEIMVYMQKNNGGRAYDSSTLQLLAAAGYVW